MCTCNNDRFCIECIDVHIRGKEFAAHRILPIGEVEMFENLQHDSDIQARCQAIDSFKDNVPTLLKQIEEAGDLVKASLARRREELVTMIDEIMHKREAELSLKLMEASNYFTQVTTDLEHWKSESKLNPVLPVCRMIERLVSVENSASIEFFGIVEGRAAGKIKEEIEDVLSDSFQLFHFGRPRGIYYFKPNSSDIKRFDADTEELLPCYVKNPVEFKDRMAWCELPDGSVVISGGWFNRVWSPEAYRFFPTRSQIEKIGSLQRGRSSHCSVYCSDRVYVLGGVTTAGQTATCEGLNMTDLIWSLTVDMAKPKSMFTAAVFDNKIYALGDTEIEVYDPSTNTFTSFPKPFENPAISLLVPRSTYLIAFRDDEITGVDVKSKVLYSISTIEQLDWWTPTQTVSKGDFIYMLLSSSNSIVKFNQTNRSLTEVGKLNMRRT